MVHIGCSTSVILLIPKPWKLVAYTLQMSTLSFKLFHKDGSDQTRQRADTSSTDANQTIHMEWEGGDYYLLGV